MKTLTIQVKDMVCPRCIHVLKQILADLEINFHEVDQGYALIDPNPFPDLEQLNNRLEEVGLGLVKDQNELLVSEIINKVHSYIERLSLFSEETKLSTFLSDELARNYHQLSKLFSKYQGITIEQFFIKLRVEKVKELIRQGKLNYSQVAISLGYSSIQYLSGQFKKVTGVTLSEYQKNWDEELSRLGKGKSHREVLNDNVCNCAGEICFCENGETKDPKTPSKSKDTSVIGISLNGKLRLVDSVREFKIEGFA